MKRPMIYAPLDVGALLATAIIVAAVLLGSLALTKASALALPLVLAGLVRLVKALTEAVVRILRAVRRAAGQPHGAGDGD
jgi:hypothetical protein